MKLKYYAWKGKSRLSKIGKLKLLKTIYGGVLVPGEVYREAVERGLEDGFSDALVIKECVDQGWRRIVRLDERREELCQRIVKHVFDIHPGEAQSIVLARETGSQLLMDEPSGRALAEAWEVRGTVYVIMKALRGGMLDKKRVKEAILQLTSRGFRVEPKLLARILRGVESFDL